MSQPEMQPENPPQEDRGPGGAGGADGREGAGGERQGKRWGGSGAGFRPSARASRPDDLTGQPFPLGDWGEPAERLDELYQWVEQSALRTAQWYLADRDRKRRGARALRVSAACATAAGAALPLLDLAGALHGASPWGYVALLVAGACIACDRYLGLTSGWIRDVATAQAVHRRLQALQFDWASESVREVLGPTEGTAGEAAERCLVVLRRFSEDITELVRTETADWMVQFKTGPAPLVTQASGAASHRSEQPAAGRPTLLPGARPNMPRQRPPDTR